MVAGLSLCLGRGPFARAAPAESEGFCAPAQPLAHRHTHRYTRQTDAATLSPLPGPLHRSLATGLSAILDRRGCADCACQSILLDVHSYGLRLGYILAGLPAA